MQPPPSIAGMTRLRRACFLDRKHGGAARALPAGPWAAGLCQLGALYDALVLSEEALEAAGQLEELYVMRGDVGAAPSAASGLLVLVRHAPAAAPAGGGAGGAGRS